MPQFASYRTLALAHGLWHSRGSCITPNMGLRGVRANLPPYNPCSMEYRRRKTRRKDSYAHTGTTWTFIEGIRYDEPPILCSCHLWARGSALVLSIGPSSLSTSRPKFRVGAGKGIQMLYVCYSLFGVISVPQPFLILVRCHPLRPAGNSSRPLCL